VHLHRDSERGDQRGRQRRDRHSDRDDDKHVHVDSVGIGGVDPADRVRWDGTGQIGYQIAPNPGTSQRTGTITAAGTTLTVTQAGVPGQPITLSGDVAGLSGSCPTVTFVVGGRSVTAGSSTTYKGGNCPKLKNGEPVIVRGLLTPQGTVDATEIEFIK
jgi:hypothetical protein